MECAIENIGDVAIIALTANLFQSENFKTCLTAIMQKYNKLVFDMRNVKLIDSTGCGILLTCLKKLTGAGGDLRLCRVQTPVLTLFELLRIHRVVDMFDTREEAAASF
jgi:anti-sigma B factor antagonist